MSKMDDLSENIGYIRAKVEKIDSLELKVDKIQSRVDGIYGYAAGAGAMATVVIYFAKEAWNRVRGS